MRMNELAKQAGYQEDMFGVGHWDMPECKKFAELIVQECANIAYEVGLHRQTKHEILRRFGLEVTYEN